MNEVVAPDVWVSTVTDSPARRDLARLYTEALRASLAEASEGALRRAGEIGRQGFTQGLRLHDLVAIHHQALAMIPLRNPTLALPEEIVRAGEFFAEAVAPYEIAQRGFREATSALRHMNETLEREIQRIAHSVHDEAGQLFDAARLAMSAIGDDLPQAVRDRLREVGTTLDRAESELRRISHELRPLVLDDLGLVPALRALADGLSRRTGVRIRIESTLPRRPPGNVEMALYRVVQEALANVVRHARARTATVRLTLEGKGRLRCAVRDDGAGFDVGSLLSRREEGGLGLLGIRERLKAVGGSLLIDSVPGLGTELAALVPLEE
jgi:signal transduction histidine kinase